MGVVENLSIRQLLRSVVIRFRSIVLIVFNIFMNILVHHLKRLFCLIKFLGIYIQKFFGIITGNHYSLVNVSDDDFSIRTTAYQLFNKNNPPKDYNKADIHDVFHIYLSKILYESRDQIIDKCMDWGFDKNLIKVFNHDQSDDLTKYTFSTQAAGIYHKESNTIIIAFRGTEPMDLLQWMTDAATNFIPLKNLFDDNIRVHAGFHSALGLNEFDPSHKIDFSKVHSKSSMFLQLLNFIQENRQYNSKFNISITGHSLGAGLASLFSFVLLSYDYESSISGVYTYGQPLVGNIHYANILNKKLGNRIHRWVNHSDIVTRIPVIELPSFALLYARTLYSDALEVAANNNDTTSDAFYKHYYHSGLRFKIDSKGNLIKQDSIDQGPILAYEDGLNLFHFKYAIQNAIYSLRNITPIRSLLWLTAPVEINDHFPGDYGRRIKKIIEIQ